MIRISWLLVSHLAAAIVILAGPDQPEQAIDTGAVLSRFMSGKRACSPRPRTSTGSMRQSQAEPLPPTAPRPPCGSLSMLAGFQSGPKRVTDKDRAKVQSNMQSRVLESNRYPDIVFRSTEVRRTGAVVWGVSGDLPCMGSQSRSASTSLGKTTPMLARFASSRRSLAFSRSKSAAVSSG
jgi:hypothetical protein